MMLTGCRVPTSALCLAEKPELDEITLERVLEELETMCYENMNIAIETEEGLGIEYDEDVVCDVCRSPEGEDGNEMVFCDKCNVCVHQVSSSMRAASPSVLHSCSSLLQPCDLLFLLFYECAHCSLSSLSCGIRST